MLSECQRSTTKFYHKILPQSSTTKFYYKVLPQNFLPQSSTIQFDHKFLPQGFTKKLYHKVPPVLSCYEVVLEFDATCEYSLILVTWMSEVHINIPDFIFAY